MKSAIRQVWWCLGCIVRDILAYRSVTAWLSRHCTDFDIVNRDWPRSWAFTDLDGNHLYIGGQQHWEVRASSFFDYSRGRGHTAWQAARRAVRALNKSSGKRIANRDDTARDMGYKDFKDLMSDI